MNHSQPNSITPAIIGGGYAGMAAAAELTSRGIPVTVFESAKQLGGRARGVQFNDARLDNGQHLLLGCYRETLRLIELVGGDVEQDFLRLPLQLDLHGQFSLKAPHLPAPLHLLVALLKAQGLTWGERMKAARFMLDLRGMAFRLPHDMTVTDLLAQHRQDADLTLKLWEPLCIAALNTPVHKASAQVLLNVLRDALNRKRADSDMLLPRLDFTTLFPQRAASVCRTAWRQGPQRMRRGNHRPARRWFRATHGARRATLQPCDLRHLARRCCQAAAAAPCTCRHRATDRNA